MRRTVNPVTWLCSICAVVALAPATWAATVVVPLAAESPLDSGLNTPLRNLPRSYQQFIDSSQLASITEPVNITGMQLRLAIGENWRPVGYVGATWPDVPISFAQFDVQLAQASAGLSSDGEYLSTTPTFASYQGADVTTVRSGLLDIAASAFSADGGAVGVHTFGVLLNFTTPYVYTPGTDLTLMIRHGGYTGGALQAFFASRGFQNNVSDAISSTVSATAAAPNGFSSPMYLQLTYAPVPEPASITTGALLLAAGAVRRRR
jgi:hypothetical protein